PLAPGQVEYQLAHGEARGLIVSGQEQADKVLPRLPALPGLEFLISFDPVDVAGKLPHLTWDALLGRGRQLGAEGLGRVLLREDALGRDSLATLIYTSGTTGPPKGVMLSHGNLLSNAEEVRAIVEVGPDDFSLSWLPFSHIYARTLDHYLAHLAGGLTFLARSRDTVVADLAEARPTMMNAVPRFYEKVWSLVEALPPEERGRRLRGLFGPRLRVLYSGGAPLPRHVCAGFHDAGLPLLEGYGLTESSPTISFNRIERFKIGTVGLAIPGVEVKIADDGEILTRGPHVMLGYWKDPEATRRAIVDGWLHTGDLGRLDEEGFLTITGRKKDLIITSGGNNIAPSELERLLLADPLIDQVVLYGDGKPFVSALIVPNLEGLRAEARALGCALEFDGELIATPALLDFLAARVERRMQAVSKPERVKAFLLLGRPFSVEAEELTPTQKVRRAEILNKFRDRLDALYMEKPPATSWEMREEVSDTHP
ncbi:MAG: long-chain fatty acid--CoA ligase, partial [Planctomycetaceae bacterium]|nr:long-chain fatty acid--CoA ligase [Planctomycetaceae bacterium]